MTPGVPEAEPQATSGRFDSLHQIAELLSESLELEVVLGRVMDIVVTVTGAERGFILMPDADGVLQVAAAHNIDRDEYGRGAADVSRSLCDRVFTSGQAEIIGDAQEDERTAAAQSVVKLQLRSMLGAPIKRLGNTIGVVYLDHHLATGRFGPRALEMLQAVGQQAGSAIENARLYEELRRDAQQIASLKDYQDRVFSSVHAAIIGLDMAGYVLSANRAARELFQAADDVIGTPYPKVLGPTLSGQITPSLIKASSGSPSATVLLTCEIGGQERHVQCSVSPLMDGSKVSGLVFLADDQTARVLAEQSREREAGERRRIRELFGRFVAEPVVEQLVANPEMAQLGGVRRTVTVLFADIRGYTTLAEQNSPEQLVALLERYLALAADTIMEFGGTLDKFMGDGVMAVFNAPLDQEEHELAAVKAGWLMQKRAVGLVEGLTFGVGVNTGDVLAGNLGTERFRNYSCVGDATNVAARLQGQAQGGELVITESTLAAVRDAVDVEPMGAVSVKGRVEPVTAYRVTDLRQSPARAQINERPPERRGAMNHLTDDLSLPSPG